MTVDDNQIILAASEDLFQTAANELNKIIMKHIWKYPLAKQKQYDYIIKTFS
jgi:hypothetical protein